MSMSNRPMTQQVLGSKCQILFNIYINIFSLLNNQLIKYKRGNSFSFQLIEVDGRDATFLVSLLQFAAPRLSLLDAKASKNLDSPMAAVAHMWSVGKRCLKQTFCLQVLHSYVMENVSISLQLFTGHLGLITFFVTSQLPNLT